jgi:hypothetical protein
MGRREMHRGFWGESQKVKGHKENLDVDITNIKMDLRK